MGYAEETTYTTATLFTVLIGAWVFSNFVNLAGLPEGLRDLVTAYSVEPVGGDAVHSGHLHCAGLHFREPFDAAADRSDLFPAGHRTGLRGRTGFNPVWFGIIVVVVTEISLITPPVGLNVFVLKGVVPDVSTGTIFRGVTPFWIADIFRLALLVLVPWLVMVLPNSM